MGAGKHVVLVGGGHAHLYALKRADQYARRGLRLTLISPRPRLVYSAMSVRLASGADTIDHMSVDVRRLVNTGGGRFIEAAAARIDRENRAVELTDGAVDWDLLSVNVGSTVRLPDGFNGVHGVLSIKPFENLPQARSKLVEILDDTSREVRALVIGSGPAGCEFAASLGTLTNRGGRRPAVAVAGSANRPLASLPAVAAEHLARNFAARGIRVLSGRRAVRAEEGSVSFDDGSSEPFDRLFWAGGPVPPTLARDSALSVDDAGYMLVNDCLQSIDDADIFGGGDCVRLAGRPLIDRAGVHAIRQGPILHRNLLARAAGEPLRAYRPQERILLILNLSDGHGLAARGRLAFYGRWPLWLKNRLDGRFLRTYAT